MTTGKLKKFAHRLGADLVGITSPDKLALPGGKASWARSVVVLAFATLDKILDANYRAEVDGVRRWSKWIYEILDAKALRLCLWLVEEGHRALVTRGGNLVNAAVGAGLGCKGPNQLLVTGKFGPRVRLVAVVTDAELDFDEPQGEDLCLGCMLCVKACPCGALSEDGFDRSKCIGEFGPNEELALKQSRMLEYLSDNVRIQCIDCMTSCPIGADVPAPPPDKFRPRIFRDGAEENTKPER